MNARRLFRALPVAAAVAALGLGIAENAHAGAYAVSYDQITNFVITGTNTTFLSTSDNSNATACLPNGSCVNSGGAGVTDAAPAQIGVVKANNDYTLVGPSGMYSRADASIDTQQLLGQGFSSARSIAEGHLSTSSTANANAGNSSGSVFTVTIVLGAPGKLHFVFDADPFLQSFLQLGMLPGSEAEAVITANISINQNGGGQVFNWSPDGLAGGISGGTETKDSFSLNTNVLALAGAEGPFTYDPANCAVGTAGGCFIADTNDLAAGTYVLNLSMKDSINLVKAVPEPGTLAIAGLGLSILGFIGRRRQKR